MPRPINPGDINVGTGLAATESIETNAFIHPTGGQEGLRVHIQDPSRAHEARAINVEDTAGNFVSDHVEGALSELAGAGASGRLNGLISGGLFTASSGLTFELDPTTTVLLEGTLHDFTGSQVLLSPSTTQYVYIDSGTQTLAVSGSAPALTSEPILIAEVTTDGVGITSSRDLRFFVFNLDRKVALTVRSDGAGFNQRSEANFVTLEAALTYLELYAGAGTDPVETHRIIVRGTHVINSTFVVPAVGVQFEGDGVASFQTGAVLSPMFDLSGRNRIQFKDITFICQHTGSVAVESTSNIGNFLMERCNFVSGAGDWANGFLFTGIGAANEDVRIIDCEFETTAGNTLRRPDRCLIQGCHFTKAAFSTAGTALTLGLTTYIGEGSSTVRDCQFEGLWTQAITYTGNNLTFDNVKSTGQGKGFTGAGSDTTFINCYVNTNSTDAAGYGGNSGIEHTAGNRLTVRDCTLDCNRTLWTAGPSGPVGIEISGGGDRHVISGCKIEGFFNSNDDTGRGIQISPGSERISISDCDINGGQYGIFAQANNHNIRVSDTFIEDVEVGIFLGGLSPHISNTNVSLNVDRGLTGASISNAGVGGSLIGCTFVNPRTVWPGSAPVGIALSSANEFVISGCRANGFLDTTNFAGWGIQVTNSDRVRISDCMIETARTGIEILGSSTDTKVVNCDIRTVRIGMTVAGDRTHISNSRVLLSTNDDEDGAEYGIWIPGGNDTHINNCTLINPRTAWTTPGGQTPTGVVVAALNTTISSSTIVGFENAALGQGAGVVLVSGSAFTNVNNCRFEDNYNAIYSTQDHNNLTVQGCNIQGTSEAILLVDSVGVATSHVKLLGNTVFVSPGNSAISVVSYIDFEIIGNTIHCQNGATSIGIYVFGANANNRRARRFVISGNNIRGASDSGIQLAGFVQNGTVSGNTIDNSIGSSVQVTGVGIRARNLSGEAPKYLIVNSNTVFNCTRGIAFDGTETEFSQYCTIDGNQIHHIAEDTAPADSYTDAGAFAIGMAWATDMTVTDNTIQFIGLMINPNETTFTPAGPDYNTHGIYIWNGDAITVTGNSVRRTTPGGAGVAYGIAYRLRQNTGTVTTNGITISDNSIIDSGTDMAAGIYVEAEDSLTTGNQTIRTLTVDGNKVTTCASDAIHINLLENGRLRECTVSDNNIHSPNGSAIQIDATGDGSEIYDLGVNNNTAHLASIDGVQIEVSGNSSLLRNASVSNNTFSAPGGFGIQVNCGLNPAVIVNLDIQGNNIDNSGTAGVRVICAATNAQIVNCGISDNRIEDAGTSGIYVNQTVGGATPTGGYFPGLSIQGNSIFQPTDAGIRLESVVAGIITGANINDNIVKEAGGNGILVDVLGGIMSFIQISNNQLWNPTLNGVGVAFLTGLLSDFQINDNHITTPGVKLGAATQGLGIAFLGDGTMTNTQINSNVISFPGYLGIGIGSIDTGAPGSPLIAGVQCLGNVIVQPGEAGIVMVNAGGAGGISDVIMSDNVISRPGVGGGSSTGTLGIHGAGITISSITGGAAIQDFTRFTFHDNQINWDIGDGGAGQLSGGIVLFSDSTRMSQIAMRGNLIENAPSTGLACIVGNKLSYWTVSDCNVTSQASATLGIPYGIAAVILRNPLDGLVVNGVVLGSPDTLTVAGNHAPPITAGDIIEIIGSTGNDGQYEVISATNNGPNTDIEVEGLTSPVADGTVDVVVVHDTITVRGCDVGTASTNATHGAISLLSAVLDTTNGNASKWRNIHVTDNVVHDSGAGLLFTALKGTNGTYPGTDPIYDNVVIDNNVFRNIIGAGVGSLFNANSTLVTPSDDLRVENIRVTNNSFTNCATSGSLNTTIGLDWPFSGININIDDNKLVDCGSNAGAAQSVIFLGCGDGQATSNQSGQQNISLCRNSLQNCEGLGIVIGPSLFATADIPVRAVRVCDNKCQGDNAAYGGIGVFYATPFALVNATVTREVAIDGNLVDFGDTGGGVGFFTTSATNVSVSNNQIRNVATNGVWLDFNGDIRNVRVEGNHTSSTGGSGVLGGHGIFVDLSAAGAACETLSVCNNVVAQTDDTTSAADGIRVLGPNSGNMLDCKIDGNQIRNASDRGIYADFPDAVQSFSCSNNTVEFGNLFGTQGIQLLLEDGVACTVSNNTVTSAKSEGIEIEFNAGVDGLTVDGNAIYQPTTDGLLLDLNATSLAVSVTGNSIYDAGANGLEIDVEGGLASCAISGNSIYDALNNGQGIYVNGSTGDLDSISVTGNTVSTVAHSGIVVQASSGDFECVTISGNTVRNYNQSGSTGSVYNLRTGIYAATATGRIRSLSIVGNTSYASANGCVGFVVGPYNVGGAIDFDCVSIVGNSAFCELAPTGTVGIRYDSGSSTRARQHTLTGNNIRGFRTTYNDANVAGTYSAVRVNTARDSDGSNFITGDWSGFITAAFSDASNTTGSNAE